MIMSKKRKWLSAIFGVLLIPGILSVILIAFEDQTNQWVMQIAGNEPVEVKTKRLAQKNELIYGDCGALGDRLEDVMKECPNYVYQLRSQSTTAPFELRHEVRIKGEAGRTVSYFFTNQVLTEMEVTDPAFAQVTFNKVKKEFNDTKHNGLNDEVSEYAYPVGKNKVTFVYDPDKRLLRTIRLEGSSIRPKGENKSVPALQKEYKASPDKELPLAGGEPAAQKLKQYMQAGDLPAYGCGALGTTYDQVLTTCGKDLVYEEQDKEQKIKRIGYEYKNRAIRLTFHEDRLTRIEVEQKDKPWKIAGVNKVFGNPVKREVKQSYYQLGQHVVVLSYNDTMQLNKVAVADAKWHKQELQKKKSDEFNLEDLIF
jgi:hypothetical protein